MGHGKSATLSSMASMIEQDTIDPAPFASSNASVTLKMFAWPLTRTVTLWDGPGEQQLSSGVMPYHNGEHLLIDQGRISAGFQAVSWPVTFGTAGVSTEPVIPFAKRMHCRVWVLRAKYAHEDALLRRLQTVLQTSAAAGITYFYISPSTFVLTPSSSCLQAPRVPSF